MAGIAPGEPIALEDAVELARWMVLAKRIPDPEKWIVREAEATGAEAMEGMM